MCALHYSHVPALNTHPLAALPAHDNPCDAFVFTKLKKRVYFVKLPNAHLLGVQKKLQMCIVITTCCV